MEDKINMIGIIKEALGGGQYLIDVDGQSVRAKLGGKLKYNQIRVIPGDRVQVTVSKYDLSHGMITYRK